MKVLLVEDDEVDKINFERSLRKSDLSLEVTHANTGKSALNQLKDQSFDCVFLDYQLPDSDGLKLLQKIKSQNPETQVIVITSHGDEKIAADSIKTGAYDYLPKSMISTEGLSLTLRNLVKFRRQELLRLEAEESLKVSEKKYRELVEQSQAIITVIQLDGTITSMNQSSADLLGYQSKDLIGVNIKQLMEPRYANKYDSFINNVRNSQKFKGIVSLAHLKGGYKYFNFNANVKLGQSGDPEILCVAQEITARIRMEKELRKARRIALESSKMKEQFLSNMSHEIRTPLNAIIGMTDLLLMGDPSIDQKEKLDLLKFSGKNLLSLVNDILDFNKIEAGKIELETIHFDLNKLMENIVNTYQIQAEEKGLHIKLKYDERLPRHYIGDSLRITQIISNLISNAIKFTDQGLVLLSLTAIDIYEASASIRFEVQDTGIGIASENLEKIFRSFEQEKEDITRIYGGTGLGLSISQRLVEFMNSEIQVSSQLGLGSKFHFDLELPLGRAEEVEHLVESPDKLPIGINVLIAEDNEVNRSFIESLFDLWRLKHEFAMDGKQAVAMAKTKKFDLVLMDINMPEMNGYEASLKIKSLKDPYFESLPIIALTASILDHSIDKMFKAGIVDYVSKPFDPKVLKKRIIQHCQNAMTPSEVEKVDLETLNSLLEGDEKAVRTIALKSVNQILNLLPEIHKSLDIDQWNRLKDLLHTLRPILYNLDMQQCLDRLPHDPLNSEYKKRNFNELLGIIENRTNVIKSFLQ